MQPSQIANQQSQMAVTEQGSNTREGSGGPVQKPHDHDQRQRQPAPQLTSPHHLSVQQKQLDAAAECQEIQINFQSEEPNQNQKTGNNELLVANQDGVNGQSEAPFTPPQQDDLSDKDKILNEQRQLSSIASFGQIQHAHNNTQSKFGGHFQNVSQFGDKNDSLQSFNYVGVDKEAQKKQEVQGDHNAQRGFAQGEQDMEDNALNKQAHGNSEMLGGQQTRRNSSQGQNESAIANKQADPNQFNSNVSGAFQSTSYQADSPSRQKASFLGEKIRQSHQQIEQLNLHHSQLAHEAQDKQSADSSNIFQKNGGQSHQNSSSMAADFGQMMSNSFDRQNLKLQLNLEQKNRSKSSTRVNNNKMSYSNNSNQDSASNLINQFINPGQDLNSPREVSENPNMKFFGQNEINFTNISKQNSFQLGGQNQQSNNQATTKSFFGPVISKQQIKYHKNAFTGRGEGNTTQGQFQNLLKLQQMQMQKHSSYQSNNPNILRSPHNMTSTHQAPNTLNLILSAHSKNSNVPNPNFNNFTMRSLKSQNSGGTQGAHTNRGDQLSLQQKSPNMQSNMSDVQDPYAYFNMHQQQQSVNTPSGPSGHTVQVSVGGMNQMIGINKLDTKLMSASGSSHQVQFAQQEPGNGVQSCRTNLYSKQQLMISQRGVMQAQQLAVFGNANNQLNADQIYTHTQRVSSQPKNGPQMPMTPNQNKDQNQLSDEQVASKEDKVSQENQKSSRQYHQSPAGTPYVLCQNQIHFNQNNEARVSSRIAKQMQGSDNSGNHSAHYYNAPSQVSNNEKKVAQNYNKGMFGLMGSAGSGSHGSNFNSSTSTFPAAPVQKLSDVKNPQKLMSFRFVNRKATKISEISLFKNLTELDLSGNLLQEQVKELSSLNFLKRISLCNNKIHDLWLLPRSIEILNLSSNLIKKMPEEASKQLKNITTIDISNNKLESLENFQYMHRIKRLLAKNNFVRELTPLQSIQNIFEIDLEGNAVDSHKDFLSFIKDKNDLIVVNLHMNPLMVEVHTIEKFNDDLIQNAPEMVTQKTAEEIEEIKELLGLNSSTNMNPNENMNEEKKSNQVFESTKGGEETNRFCINLIEELACCLNFLKGGVLYRNKRVFNKLKQIQLKSKRSASNYSNSSHSIVNNSSMVGGLKNHTSQPTAASQHTFNRGSKDGGSNQDRNSAKLTPPSANQNNQYSRHSNVCLPSSQAQGKLTQKNNLSNSAAFSPILSIKSQRYEDVEAIYDNIVEQEELRRLKQKKIMAKKRQLKKKQMMSQLDGTDSQVNQGDDNSDSDNNSSDFSDDVLDDDEMDDLDNLEDLGLIDRDDLDEDMDDSCMIGQDSSRCLDYQQFGNYQHENLHDDEVMSQTITSDLEADLHSYKRGDDNQDIDHYYNQNGAGDDNDYLNGSTAGFGKKLREINREINQEQEDQCDDSGAINFPQLQPATNKKQMQQFQSVEKEKSKKIDSSQIKIKTKFDLNLSKLQRDKNQNFVQSDLKINIYDQKHKFQKPIGTHSGEPIEGVTILNHKKQVKTTQNSNENSQNGESQNNLLDGSHMNHAQEIGTMTNSNEDQYNYERDQQQQLNQSFSLKNIQQHGDNLHEINFNKEEVESLMMNQQIIQRGGQEALPQNEAAAAGDAVMYDAFHQQQHQMEEKQNGSKKKMMQGSMSQNLQASNMLSLPSQSINQSVNQSLYSESIAQSVVSVTQNSKKNVIPSFKLDLSKCKQDDEFGNNFDENDIQGLQKELKAQSIVSEMQINNYKLSNGKLTSWMGNEQESEQESKDQEVQLDDIILRDQGADFDQHNIDEMKINVSDDGHRRMQSTAKKASISSNPMDNKDKELNMKSPKQNVKKTITFSQQKIKSRLSPEVIDKLRKSREFQPEQFNSQSNLAEGTSSKGGNKTVRDPTPAPYKPRTANGSNRNSQNQQNETTVKSSSNSAAKDKQINKTERIENQQNNLKPDSQRLESSDKKQVASADKNKLNMHKCKQCLLMEKTIQVIKEDHKQEMEVMKEQLGQHQKVLQDIKKYLGLSGELEFQPGLSQSLKKGAQHRSLNLSNFADKVHLMFRRMYADLEKIRIENNKLAKTQKLNQNQIMQLKIGQINSEFQQNDISLETQMHRERNVQDPSQVLRGPMAQQMAEVPDDQAFVKVFQASKSTTQRNINEQALMDGRQGENQAQIQQEGEEDGQYDGLKPLNLAKSASPAPNSKQIQNSGPQKVMIQHPKVYGKDKGILQIKMNDIQKPSMPSISSSEMQSVIEGNRSEDNNKREDAIITKLKKQAAKTMRNMPLSTSEPQTHSTQQPQRVNSNPKLQINQAPTYQKKYEHIQYEANTFSSQYSLSQQQTVFQPQRIDDEHFDSKLLQDSLNDESSQKNQQASSMQASQLQLMSNGVKVLKQPSASSKPSKQAELIKGSKQPQQIDVLQNIQKIYQKNQANTARSRGAGQKVGIVSNPQLSKKQKSPAQQQYHTHVEHTPNSQDLGSTKNQYLHQLQKSQRNMNKTLQNQSQNQTNQQQLQQILQGNHPEQLPSSTKQQKIPSGNPSISKLNHLQKSLEQIKKESSQQNNYKTSRIPITNSKSFIEAANMQKMNVNVAIRDQTMQQNEQHLLLEEMPQVDFYSQIEQQSQSLNQNYNLSTNEQKYISLNMFQNPLINSSANSASMQTEKRKQKIKVNERGQLLQIPQVLNVAAVAQSYSTQRKTQSGFKTASGLSSAGNTANVNSGRPASRENKTQRIQRQQLLNKSGGGQATSLQQTYDQDIRGQSVNLSLGPNVHGMTVATETNSMYNSKRPQSVVEGGGRKFQKIQQQMVVFNKLNHNTTNKSKGSKSKSKSKNKSSERNHSRSANHNMKSQQSKNFNKAPNETSPAIDIDFKIQINNLNANIQNIQNIQNTKKYNTSAKNQMQHKNQLQQQIQQMSLTNRASNINSVQGQMHGAPNMNNSSTVQMSKQSSMNPQQISRQNSKQEGGNQQVYTPLYQEPDDLLLMQLEGSHDFLESINDASNTATGRRTTLPIQPQGQPQLNYMKPQKQRRRSNNFTNIDKIQQPPLGAEKEPDVKNSAPRRSSYQVKTTRGANYSNQKTELPNGKQIEQLIENIKLRNSSMEERPHTSSANFCADGLGHQLGAGLLAQKDNSTDSLDSQDYSTRQQKMASNILILPNSNNK